MMSFETRLNTAKPQRGPQYIEIEVCTGCDLHQSGEDELGYFRKCDGLIIRRSMLSIDDATPSWCPLREKKND